MARSCGSTARWSPASLRESTADRIRRALTAFGATYTFEWPDGTLLRVAQLGGYGLNVRVTPSASRRGSLEGVLGNADGKPDNDDSVVSTIADRWRLTQAASLFDYQAGQSAATFVDPTFPNPGDGVPDRATAERDCREEGITDSQLLHDCIIDFGITNGFLFRGQYAHQQEVLAAVAALGPSGPPAGAADRRVLVMAGTVADRHATPTFPIPAQAGDVLYVPQTPDCVDRDKDWLAKPESVIWLSIFDPSGRQVGSAHPGCEMGRIALPAAGTYTMKANVARNQAGAYSVPIDYVRHDRVKAVAYGDILAGTIEQPGAHDVYTFTGKTGDIVQIAGKDCLLHDMFSSIINPDGSDVLGPACRDGSTTRLFQDGTYQFVVNSTNTGTGPYRFVLQGVSGK